MSTSEVPSSWKTYLLYVGSAMLFFGVIILYVIEFFYFDKTLRIGRLVGVAMLIAIVVGSYMGYHFRKQAEDLTEQIQIYIFFIIACLIVMPLFANLSNRVLAFRPVEMKEVELVKVEPYFSSRYGLLKGESPEPSGYRVYFIYDNELKQVSVKKLWFAEPEQARFITIPLQKGVWGFTFINL